MNFNKVILLGNLTRDPQLSYTPNQTAVCEFGIAVNRKWTSQDGNEQNEVLFMDCMMFGKRGEAVNKYCMKGEPLLVEGRLKLDTWKQDDGLQRSKIRLVVENFQFIGGQADKPEQRPDRKDKPVDDDGDSIPF